MRISEAARTTGLSVSAIRFYERSSIVRGPSRNGRNRDYSESDIRQLRFVRNARSLGIPLQYIAEILRGPENRVELAKMVSDHRKVVKSKIEALKRVNDVLVRLEECMCNGVSNCQLADGDG
ncbi:MAG: MerR family transcriptional regulator [Pseudomonadota bacterium]